MKDAGTVPIMAFMVLAITTVGLIAVYAYLSGPLETIERFVENRIEEENLNVPTTPISNYRLVWIAAPALLVIVSVVWVFLKMHESEYEREYYEA